MIRRSGLALVACVLVTPACPASAIAAAPPSIESEAASRVGASDATLEASINPNELQTEYQFRVTASPCFANPTNCSEGPDPLFPAEPRVIAAGSAAESVSVRLKAAGMSLEPAREYHYAVVAHNAEGTETGPDQTFTTASPPSVVGESAINVTPHDATLQAEIDPGGGPDGAYYQFQLAKGPGEFAAGLECPPEPISGPFIPCIGPHAAGALSISRLFAGPPRSVDLDLSDAGVTLDPGTTYHYRVLVAPAVQTEDTIEWESPTVAGADQSFVTPGVCADTITMCVGPPRPQPGPPGSQPPAPECSQGRHRARGHHRRRHRHHHHHHKHHHHHHRPCGR